MTKVSAMASRMNLWMAIITIIFFPVLITQLGQSYWVLATLLIISLFLDLRSSKPIISLSFLSLLGLMIIINSFVRGIMEHLIKFDLGWFSLSLIGVGVLMVSILYLHEVLVHKL